MSACYEIATLTMRTRTTPKALPGIERWLRDVGRGELFACLYSEIGPVNRILVLRRFDDAAALMDERRDLVHNGNAFGASEYITALATDAFLPCTGVPLPSTTSRGPWFEVRDYRMTHDGVRRLLDLWQPVLPARMALAPMYAALYAVSGELPRLVHIYPWANLEQRQEVRNAAREVGWPPAGAHEHVVAQEATLYLAAPFSPVQ